MRRFDENATLDKIADRGELQTATIVDLARAIHTMHARAPIRDAEPAIASMRRWIEQNAAAFAERPDLFPARGRDRTGGALARSARTGDAAVARARRETAHAPLSWRSASRQYRADRR